MKNFFRATLLVLLVAMGFTYYNGQRSNEPKTSVIIYDEDVQNVKTEKNVPQEEHSEELELVRTSDVPLFLQTGDEWKDIPYGTDGDQDMAENGCAIATLAMIGNYYGFGSTPETVKDWAQNDYYVHEAGTSWEIFEDFSLLHDLTFLNLGNDIEWAKEELIEGHLIVVSVDVSQFTEVGHIMLLTGYKDGKFSLNDPNDDLEEKFHNYNWYDSSIIEEAGINYWSYSL